MEGGKQGGERRTQVERRKGGRRECGREGWKGTSRHLEGGVRKEDVERMLKF